VSKQIERPIFFENQILGAADLTAAVEHSRGQQARHNRYLHLWGIANGLEISVEDNEDKSKTLTLSAGIAIDGTGREIVVPQPEQLSEKTFVQLQVTAGLAANALEEAWFPVFLVGREQPAEQPPLAIGACESPAPTREVEGYEVRFGKLGSERDLDRQDAGSVSDGPGKGGWQILLGFVKTNGQGDKFIDFLEKVDGVGRRYAGVLADEVAARKGVLTFRTTPAPTANKPLLILNGEKEGSLQFGSLDSGGNVKPVFTVDTQGNLTVDGKIKGALTTGGVQVESGIATDGMILPLPPAITQKQVKDGDAIIQTQISLRLTGQTTPPGSTATGENWGAFPLESYVDAERRVHCRVRWFRVAGGSGSGIEDHPAVCDYILLASVKEKK